MPAIEPRPLAASVVTAVGDDVEDIGFDERMARWKGRSIRREQRAGPPGVVARLQWHGLLCRRRGDIVTGHCDASRRKEQSRKPCPAAAAGARRPVTCGRPGLPHALSEK